MPRRQLLRPPRSPATSPAQYPAGSGIGVSVLLRQPHSFEGFGPRVEVGPPEAPPAPPADHLPEHLLDRGVATRAVGTSTRGCERQVPPLVVQLIRLDAEVGARSEQVRP